MSRGGALGTFGGLKKNLTGKCFCPGSHEVITAAENAKYRNDEARKKSAI